MIVETVPRFLAVLCLVNLSACRNPFNPEAGLPVPVNPGAVLISVIAVSQNGPQNAAPVSGVSVRVTDIPNSVGSTYSVSATTGADGRIVLSSIPAGNRGVEITVPAGYVAGSEGTSRRVDVVANQTTAVPPFTLIRQ